MDGSFLNSIVTSIMTIAGGYVLAWYTVNSSSKKEAEDHARVARYLAIRIVCKLDPFVSQCCDVAGDDGEPGEGDYFQESIDAPKISFPEDEDWQSLDPSLMYRTLGFPNEIDIADQTIAAAWRYEATPPDYPEFFAERKQQYARLGLRALELADQIRSQYSIPPAGYHSWSPREALEKTLAEIQEEQKKRTFSVADWDTPATSKSD